MTPEQLSVICGSSDKALSTEPDFVSKFCLQLSSDYPGTKLIFDSFNMDEQHTRFIGMLSSIVDRMCRT